MFFEASSIVINYIEINLIRDSDTQMHSPNTFEVIHQDNNYKNCNYKKSYVIYCTIYIEVISCFIIFTCIKIFHLAAYFKYLCLPSREEQRQELFFFAIYIRT